MYVVYLFCTAYDAVNARQIYLSLPRKIETTRKTYSRSVRIIRMHKMKNRNEISNINIILNMIFYMCYNWL